MEKIQISLSADERVQEDEVVLAAKALDSNSRTHLSTRIRHIMIKATGGAVG